MIQMNYDVLLINGVVQIKINHINLKVADISNVSFIYPIRDLRKVLSKTQLDDPIFSSFWNLFNGSEIGYLIMTTVREMVIHQDI